MLLKAPSAKDIASMEITGQNIPDAKFEDKMSNLFSHIRGLVDGASASLRSHDGRLDGLYPVVDPFAGLPSGQHIRIRGCFCNWAHIEEGLLGSANGLVGDNRSIVWLSEASSPRLQARLTDVCLAHGRGNDFRLVGALPIHGRRQISHSVPVQVGHQKWVQMTSYCPNIMSGEADVDMTGASGNQVILWHTPSAIQGDVGVGILSETLDMVEASAMERRRNGRDPFVLVLAFVAEGEAAGLLGGFLERMANLGVSVIVTERIHADNSACIPANDVDSLFATALEGACWTTASAVGVVTVGDRDRWNNNAFLVRRQDFAPVVGVRRQAKEIRLPNCAEPSMGHSRETLVEALQQSADSMRPVAFQPLA